MKVALVYNHASSDWLSCKKIIPNLKRCYELLFKNNEIVNIDFSNSRMDHLYEVSESLRELNADYVIFIDHSPCPAKLLTVYKSLYEKLPRNLVIHIFGDFVLDIKEWIKLRKELVKHPCLFVCASHAQRDLVLRHYCSGLEKSVLYCPFPVDTNVFRLQPEQKKKKFKDEPETFDILYTGRISAQKNIVELVASYNVFKNNLNYHSRLNIAGSFDDIGYPYFGKRSNLNEYYHRLNKVLSDLQEDTYRSINFMGMLNQEALVVAYNQADLFVSFSTFNDEDFGMSPIEAACCGTPSLLSRWGGYKSFSVLGREAICLLPLEKSSDRFVIKSKEIMNGFFYFCSHGLNREHIALKAQKYFSIKSCAERLQSIFERDIPPFLTDDANFKEIERIFLSRELPFVTVTEAGRCYSDFYFDLYKSYWDDSL